MAEMNEKKMVCPKCQKMYAEGAKFCPDCGVALQEVQQEQPKNNFCPNCGERLTPETAFCPNCGEKRQGGKSFDAEKWKKVVFSPNESTSNEGDGQPRKVSFEKIEKATDKADKITIFCLRAGIVIGALMALVGIIRAVSDRMWMPILAAILALGMSALSWLALRYFKKHNLNFDDTGDKIKKVARLLNVVTVWICIIGAIISLAIAIYISIKGSVILGIGLFLLALFLLLVGPILAWLANLCLYGFGEIIVKLDAIEKNTHHEEEKE